MDLKTGTPWWGTILTAILTLFGSHFLTIYRDGRKGRRDKEDAWFASCEALIKEIVDDASKHYCDAGSIASTDLSAAQINNNLKRLSNVARELKAKDPSDSAKLKKLLQSFRAIITFPEDYQDGSRTPRKADDIIFENIRACEEDLISNLKRPRAKKKK
ncbi:hypothetical protein [uncultured Stenotrophomonas sp.]|uniref:hypothetical protein n=1 Tax=uncultured Stenotrophomonas sp. TaxID=165438 RepID=UPI00258560F7|nr:hypothetical protein [uncultured Stenotrophomonas sp.]